MDAYRAYMDASPGTIAAKGGQYPARGGETVTLEGDWRPQRVVLLEFESLEAAQEWYASQRYQAAKSLREGVASLRISRSTEC
jgi:uncharacterized protein (DUF1330 family)